MAIMPSNDGKIDEKIEKKIKNIDKAVKEQVGKTKTKSKKKKYVVIGVFAFVIFLIVFGAFLVVNLISKINTVSINEDNLGAKPLINEKIKNIALFGIDHYEGGGRSDAIMILSVDIKKKEVKLTSVLRDSYVKIKDYGYDKINHAYKFGGPELAIRTLNENFHLDITDYVTVDFANLSHIIDAMGGITIDISKEEFPYMKSHIEDTARDMKVPPDYVKKSGVQHVNGLQAVSYARIRKIGNGDVARTERQREVMNALMKKALELPITSYYGVLTELLQYVETSLDVNELMGLSKVASPNLQLTQYAVPSELDLETGGNRRINGIFYFVYDLYEASDNLHKFIYEDDASNISETKPDDYYLPESDPPKTDTNIEEEIPPEEKEPPLFIPAKPSSEEDNSENNDVDKPEYNDGNGGLEKPEDNNKPPTNSSGNGNNNNNQSNNNSSSNDSSSNDSSSNDSSSNDSSSNDKPIIR